MNIKHTLSILLLSSGLLVSNISLAGDAATGSTKAKESEIQKAFLKEYAFLQTQKRELLDQIAKFEKKSKHDKQQEEQQVTSLEKDLRYSELELERLQDDSVLLEHQLAETSGSKELLVSTVEQALASFKDIGVNVDHIKASESLEQQLFMIYSLANDVITARSGVSKQKGEFFDASGKKIFGDIITVGAVSSLASVDGKTSILVPAGAGKLKASAESESVNDEQLFNGDESDVKLFLYENLNKSFDESGEKSLFDVINSGGLIGWVIVALGAIAVLLVVMRVMFLRRSSESIDVIQSQTVECIARGDIDAAKEICAHSKGATARVVNAALRNINRDREHLEDVVSESILHENAYLNRFGTFITVIAAVSPLLGLLGTVTGMIATFDVITEFGTGDPKLLSGGISTALVTTELGLIVAIPALMFGNLLASWSNRIKDEMEKAALRVINTYNSVEVLKPKAA